MNQENTSLDGKLALRIGDSLLGSAEDPASSPSLPKNNYNLHTTVVKGGIKI